MRRCTGCVLAFMCASASVARLPSGPLLKFNCPSQHILLPQLCRQRCCQAAAISPCFCFFLYPACTSLYVKVHFKQQFDTAIHQVPMRRDGEGDAGGALCFILVWLPGADLLRVSISLSRQHGGELDGCRSKALGARRKSRTDP